MRRLRAPGPGLRVVLAVLTFAAGCGVFSEAKKAEAPPPDAADALRPTLRIAHIPAPRLRAEDPASVRRLEEAVGVVSSFVGLDAVLFGGDLIANESAATAPAAIDAFTSLAGIIAAKRYVALGDRERSGALSKDEVLRPLERKKLVPDRTGTYTDLVKPGVRIVVIDVAADGKVAPEAAKVAIAAVREAKEPLIVVAADVPPLDPAVQEQFRADPRVKAVLFRAAKAAAVESLTEPATIASPPIDVPVAPVIRLVEIDGKTCRVRLIAVPGGVDVGEPQTLTLRSDRPAK